MRFIFKGRGGALSSLDSPEETALVNYNPSSLDDGVWYLSHALAEYKNGTASSLEDKRYFSATKYTIETAIANNDHLTSIARIELKPVFAGDRVVRFGLLPNLRVQRVADEAGNNLYFVQENRHADGSFYVILPVAATAAQTITVEYSGDKVLLDAGNGSFYVRAREAWYPALNGFSERSLYDLTFRVPKKYRLISVGSLEREGMEDNFYVSHWITPKPVAIAGFNYGDYQHVTIPDDVNHYEIDGCYLPQLPDRLARFRDRRAEWHGAQVNDEICAGADTRADGRLYRVLRP